MSQRADFLVEKRDGRIQRLRATKLARSIYLALRAANRGELGRAADLASAVLTGLRVICDHGRPVRSQEIASAVQRALTGAGFPAAAWTYDGVSRERARRRSMWFELAMTSPSISTSLGSGPGPGPASGPGPTAPSPGEQHDGRHQHRKRPRR